MQILLLQVTWSKTITNATIIYDCKYTKANNYNFWTLLLYSVLNSVIIQSTLLPALELQFHLISHIYSHRGTLYWTLYYIWSVNYATKWLFGVCFSCSSSFNICPMRLSVYNSTVHKVALDILKIYTLFILILCCSDDEIVRDRVELGWGGKCLFCQLSQKWKPRT